jgi:FlaA1/EpsC-like NDP-sugar epimerase
MEGFFKHVMTLPDARTPRWVVVVVDLLLSFIALALAYLVRFDVYSNMAEVLKEWGVLQSSLPFYIGIKLLVFYVFKIHKGLIRYTSFEDIRRIFLAVTTSTAILLIGGLARAYWFDGAYLLPISVLFTEFLTSIFLLVGFRFAVKVIYYEVTQKPKVTKGVIIYGAGVSGLITKRTLERDTTLGVHLIAFIDDDQKLAGNRLEGVDIKHTSELEKLIRSYAPQELIIAIQNPNKNNVSNVIDSCIKQDISVQTVPNFKSWINGEFSLKQIRKVSIEELLGRQPIHLNEDRLFEELKQKVILVTGAAGSIGSGLVQQLLRYDPGKIILLDQAESPMYDLQNELIKEGFGQKLEVVIGDIRSYDRMKRLFSALRPELVFHAAAYKHVPLMELNPTEAVRTNVLGTKNIVDLSDEFNVEKFVLISTDKAVNPTNVMGASKRIAEIYTSLRNSESTTKYITTRFGNVLGSNGSVIPLFRRQIAQGGPVTVTHEEVTRYFMTIPEACQLVLEAGVMGQGGEVYVFDMGESVKIIDLAKKMIKLSGLEIGKDIEIQVTGLRPGEKLFEELLADREETIATHHPKILIAKLNNGDESKTAAIEELIQLFDRQDNFELVKQMKGIVPEFISNNSEFSNLDHE